MIKESVINTYNSFAEEYELSVDFHNPWNIDYERPALVKLLPKNIEGKRILDIGCAAGWYSEYLINKGAIVTSIDISQGMVAATKRRVGSKGSVHCLDISEKTPFKNNEFDIIICSLVLHYIRDWEPVFYEVSRILKNGGEFIYSVHHPLRWSELNIKNYFNKQVIESKWRRKLDNELINVSYYHRTLNEIINETLKYFNIDVFLEPIPTKNFKQKRPAAYKKLSSQPNFLLIKAVSNRC